MKPTENAEVGVPVKKKRGQEEEEIVRKEPEVVEYNNDSQTLFDIFEGHWGAEEKEDAETRELYYDFTPYNVKDPILLALMARDIKI